MAPSLADESPGTPEPIPAHEETPSSEHIHAAASEGAGSVLDFARRLLAGGVDTVTMTLDEMTEFVQRLVGRGGISEADAARLVQEFAETRPDAAHNGANGFGSEGSAAASGPGHALMHPSKTPGALERSVETILVRLNVPTRSDIESLSRKIALLNDKVTRLKELREAERHTPAPTHSREQHETSPAPMRTVQSRGKNGQPD